MEYAVFSRRILTGTIADLPYSARLAWQAIIFEAEKLRGKAKIPIRDLARWASITPKEAAEAMRLFQEPDEFSSTKEDEGRRLQAIEGEEDWYTVVSWEKHAAEREAYFARLRKQRQRSKDRGDATEPPPSDTLFPAKEEPKKEKRGSRLPEPFVVTPEMTAWATKEVSTLDVDAATKSFCDYWRGVPGKDGVKLDWIATWRNGMKSRNERGQFQKKGGRGAIRPAPGPGEDV